MIRGFEHVYWLGGSPCSGKTSVAGELARRHGLQVYHFDRHEMDHFRRRIDAGDEQAAAFLALSMDERWLGSAPPEMGRDTIESWTRRFPLVLEDLRAMPTSPPILAEGPGLFPGLVATVTSGPRRMVCLVSTPGFCEQVRRTRPGGAAAQTSDPERALANIVERDRLMAEYIREQASVYGIPVIELDGRHSISEVAAMVNGYLFDRVP